MTTYLIVIENYNNLFIYGVLKLIFHITISNFKIKDFVKEFSY